MLRPEWIISSWALGAYLDSSDKQAFYSIGLQVVLTFLCLLFVFFQFVHVGKCHFLVDGDKGYPIILIYLGVRVYLTKYSRDCLRILLSFVLIEKSSFADYPIQKPLKIENYKSSILIKQPTDQLNDLPLFTL